MWIDGFVRVREWFCQKWTNCIIELFAFAARTYTQTPKRNGNDVFSWICWTKIEFTLPSRQIFGLLFLLFGLFSFLFATLRIYLCISLIYVLTFVEQKKILHIFIELFFFISLLAHWCEYVCGCVSERERLCVRVHGEFDKSIRMTVQFLCSMLSWMTVKWAAAACNSAICPVHTYGAQMRNKKYSIDKKVNKRMQKLARLNI